MRPLRLQLNASTQQERHAMTKLMCDRIQEADGWILDTHSFSNLSLCLHFELPPAQLSTLLDTLEADGLRWTSQSTARVQEWQTKRKPSTELCIGTLQVAFVHNEPDQKQVIPAVPGA